MADRSAIGKGEAAHSIALEDSRLAQIRRPESVVPEFNLLLEQPRCEAAKAREQHPPHSLLPGQAETVLLAVLERANQPHSEGPDDAPSGSEREPLRWSHVAGIESVEHSLHLHCDDTSPCGGF